MKGLQERKPDSWHGVPLTKVVNKAGLGSTAVREAAAMQDHWVVRQPVGARQRLIVGAELRQHFLRGDLCVGWGGIRLLAGTSDESRLS